MKLGKGSGRNNFEAFNRKSLVCLETICRNKDVTGSSGEDSETAKKSRRERIYCLREYIYCHEQGIATNMNIKDTSGEVSRY